MRVGYHLGSELTVFVSNSTGLGGKVSYFRTKNDSYASYAGFNGRILDDITILYIGPTLSFRVLNPHNTRNYSLFAFSIGYMEYTNKANYYNTPFKLTANNVGASTSASMNFMSRDGVGISLRAALYLGSFDEFEVSSPAGSGNLKLDDNVRESMSRLELLVGVVF